MVSSGADGSLSTDPHRSEGAAYNTRQGALKQRRRREGSCCDYAVRVFKYPSAASGIQMYATRWPGSGIRDGHRCRHPARPSPRQAQRHRVQNLTWPRTIHGRRQHRKPARNNGPQTASVGSQSLLHRESRSFTIKYELLRMHSSVGSVDWLDVTPDHRSRQKLHVQVLPNAPSCKCDIERQPPEIEGN